MSILFVLLFLISILYLIVGLISPKIFSKLFKEKTNRKTVGLAFGGTTVLLFILVGITAPDTIPTSAPAQSTNNTEAVAPTSAPVTTLTPEEEALAKQKADEEKAKQEADAKAQTDAKVQADAKAKQEADAKVQADAKAQEPVKELTTMDKLWVALDESIKTRDGFDIQYGDSGSVLVTTRTESFWDANETVETAFRQLVQYGLKAFQIDGVSEIRFQYGFRGIDQYGNDGERIAVDISMKKDEFKKYDWKNLEGHYIYNQMESSSQFLGIHPDIRAKLNTDKVMLWDLNLQ